AESRFVGYTDHDPLLGSYLRKYYATAEARALRRLSSANSHRAMVDILLASDCYAVLPYLSVRPLIEEGRLKQASSKSLKNTLYLVHPVRDHEPMRLKAMAEHLRARCREESRRRKVGVSP
ncbi:MAG TPA: LysR substrate-binding domain-containing protein, partial [Bdellovibrionota bacterium]|nr:LysR substrate-binding domain-containing protein [Bdellovibrionota bacterium]